VQGEEAFGRGGHGLEIRSRVWRATQVGNSQYWISHIMGRMNFM